MAKAKMGRHSIFEGKVDGKRVQAVITQEGGRAFEKCRGYLASVYTRIMQAPVPEPGVSDADVVEFLARGEKNTVGYLRKKKAKASK